MIKVTAKHLVKEEKIKEFIHYAKKLVSATINEDGCIKYELFQDEQNPKILTIIEEWENKEVLDLHMKSPHFVELVPILNEFNEKDTDVNLYKKIV